MDPSTPSSTAIATTLAVLALSSACAATAAWRTFPSCAADESARVDEAFLQPGVRTHQSGLAPYELVQRTVLTWLDKQNEDDWAARLRWAMVAVPFNTPLHYQMARLINDGWEKNRTKYFAVLAAGTAAAIPLRPKLVTVLRRKVVGVGIARRVTTQKFEARKGAPELPIVARYPPLR